MKGRSFAGCGGVDRKSHWERIYETRQPTGVSWYQPRLLRSLELILACAPPLGARMIDVGGGASTLVDDLLTLGFHKLAVLDISRAAIAGARARLGPRADAVQWIEADVTQAVLPAGGFDLWHDRAVFHFLTQAEDRNRYRGLLAGTLAPGGHAVIATFGPGGPERCSGLEIVRYDLPGLARELGPAFETVEGRTETHRTPSGTPQEFVYGLFRRR